MYSQLLHIVIFMFASSYISQCLIRSSSIISSLLLVRKLWEDMHYYSIMSQIFPLIIFILFHNVSGPLTHHPHRIIVTNNYELTNLISTSGAAHPNLVLHNKIAHHDQAGCYVSEQNTTCDLVNMFFTNTSCFQPYQLFFSHVPLPLPV